MTPAPDLATLQTRFTAILATRRDWHSALAALAPTLNGSAQTHAAALELYRDNQRALWRAALDNAFPVVCQLVGDEFFGGLAQEYGAQHPSRSGDLNQYGAQFAAFLSGFAPVAQLPYLPDVATLEWACHATHYAADARSSEPADGLSGFSGATTLAMSLFDWHPAVAVVETPYPVAAIWLAHQTDTPSLEGVALDTPSNYVALVWRTAGESGIGAQAQVAAITHAQAALLRALKTGRTFGEALYAALSIDAGFELGDDFGRWVTWGILLPRAATNAQADT